MKKKRIKVSIKPLSKQDKITRTSEDKLLTRWKRGDDSIRDVILKRYFPYIASIARKYHGFFPWIEFIELVEEGNFGLLQALDRYDNRRDARFTSYAWFWITKCMQEYIRQHIVVLKIPARVIRNLRMIEKQIEKEISNNNEVSLEEIVKKIDMGLDEVKSLLSEKNTIMSPLSLDQTIGDEEERQTLKDYIKSDDLPSDEFLEKTEDNRNIEELLCHLSDDEAEVIQWRFGFKDNNYHPLNEIAKKMKISPQKVKDLEMQALLKLKAHLAEKDEQNTGS